MTLCYSACFCLLSRVFVNKFTSLAKIIQTSQGLWCVLQLKKWRPHSLLLRHWALQAVTKPEDTCFLQRGSHMSHCSDSDSLRFMCKLLACTYFTSVEPLQKVSGIYQTEILDKIYSTVIPILDSNDCGIILSSNEGLVLKKKTHQSCEFNPLLTMIVLSEVFFLFRIIWRCRCGCSTPGRVTYWKRWRQILRVKGGLSPWTRAGPLPLTQCVSSHTTTSFWAKHIKASVCIRMGFSVSHQREIRRHVLCRGFLSFILRRPLWFPTRWVLFKTMTELKPAGGIMCYGLILTHF